MWMPKSANPHVRTSATARRETAKSMSRSSMALAGLGGRGGHRHATLVRTTRRCFRRRGRCPIEVSFERPRNAFQRKVGRLGREARFGEPLRLIAQVASGAIGPALSRRWIAAKLIQGLRRGDKPGGAPAAGADERFHLERALLSAWRQGRGCFRHREGPEGESRDD